jgi:hypothetical protein
MYEHKLLTVEEHFQLTNIGLTVYPDFSVPANGKWNDFFTESKVVCPNGTESIHKIHIGTWHFNFRDPKVSIDKRWRVVISFPDSDKVQIPIGSAIYVSTSDYLTIMGENI